MKINHKSNIINHKSKFISQIQIEPYIVRLIDVIEGGFERTEHAIHAIGKRTSPKAFFFQDVLDLMARKGIVAGQADVMDACNALAELDASDEQGVVHELHL